MFRLKKALYSAPAIAGIVGLLFFQSANADTAQEFDLGPATTKVLPSQSQLQTSRGAISEDLDLGRGDGLIAKFARGGGGRSGGSAHSHGSSARRGGGGGGGFSFGISISPTTLIGPGGIGGPGSISIGPAETPWSEVLDVRSPEDDKVKPKPTTIKKKQEGSHTKQEAKPTPPAVTSSPSPAQLLDGSLPLRKVESHRAAVEEGPRQSTTPRHAEVAPMVKHVACPQLSERCATFDECIQKIQGLLNERSDIELSCELYQKEARKLEVEVENTRKKVQKASDEDLEGFQMALSLAEARRQGWVTNCASWVQENAKRYPPKPSQTLHILPGGAFLFPPVGKPEPTSDPKPVARVPQAPPETTTPPSPVSTGKFLHRDPATDQIGWWEFDKSGTPIKIRDLTVGETFTDGEGDVRVYDGAGGGKLLEDWERQQVTNKKYDDMQKRDPVDQGLVPSPFFEGVGGPGPSIGSVDPSLEDLLEKYGSLEQVHQQMYQQDVWESVKTAAAWNKEAKKLLEWAQAHGGHPAVRQSFGDWGTYDISDKDYDAIKKQFEWTSDAGKLKARGWTYEPHYQDPDIDAFASIRVDPSAPMTVHDPFFGLSPLGQIKTTIHEYTGHAASGLNPGRKVGDEYGYLGGSSPGDPAKGIGPHRPRPEFIYDTAGNKQLGSADSYVDFAHNAAKQILGPQFTPGAAAAKAAGLPPWMINQGGVQQLGKSAVAKTLQAVKATNKLSKGD